MVTVHIIPIKRTVVLISSIKTTVLLVNSISTIHFRCATLYGITDLQVHLKFISYCASHFFILFRSLNTFVLELCIPVLIFDKSCPEAFVTFALLVSNLPALLQIPLESLRIAQLFK